MVELVQIPNGLGWLAAAHLGEVFDAASPRPLFGLLHLNPRVVSSLSLAVDLCVDDAGRLLYPGDDRGLRGEGLEACMVIGELRIASGGSGKSGSADEIVGVSARPIRVQCGQSGCGLDQPEDRRQWLWRSEVLSVARTAEASPE